MAGKKKYSGFIKVPWYVYHINKMGILKASCFWAVSSKKAADLARAYGIRNISRVER